MTDDRPSALAFAVLIGSAPELTDEYVTTAYEAALRAWQRRDDVPKPPLAEQFADSVYKTRAEALAEPRVEDDLARALSAPVEGRDIARPVSGANVAMLEIAATRFVSLSGKLPDLGTRAGRQGLWNLVPGDRPVREMAVR